MSGATTDYKKIPPRNPLLFIRLRKSGQPGIVQSFRILLQAYLDKGNVEMRIGLIKDLPVICSAGLPYAKAVYYFSGESIPRMKVNERHIRAQHYFLHTVVFSVLLVTSACRSTERIH